MNFWLALACDAPSFDNWQLLQAEYYRRELTQALECLVEGYSGRGDFEHAINYAHRWIALDPFNETAHCPLIRLYAWSGQRQAALRQYHECVKRLERELGVPPLASTTELYQAVKSNKSLPMPEQLSTIASFREARYIQTYPPEGAPQPIPSPTIQSMLQKIIKVKLIGRRHELAVMEGLWKKTVSGERQVLLISGEAGIGKTRLVLEAARVAENQGALVLTGRCDTVSSVPYAPIAQIIRNAFDYFYTNDSEIPAHILADLLTITPQLRVRYPHIPPNLSIESQFEQQRAFL